VAIQGGSKSIDFTPPKPSQLSQGVSTVAGIGEELEAPSKIGDRTVIVSLTVIDKPAVVSRKSCR
jgi:hypothetical protein